MIQIAVIFLISLGDLNRGQAEGAPKEIHQETCGHNLFGFLFVVQDLEDRLRLRIEPGPHKYAVDKATIGLIQRANLTAPVAKEVFVDVLKAAVQSPLQDLALLAQHGEIDGPGPGSNHAGFGK